MSKVAEVRSVDDEKQLPSVQQPTRETFVDKQCVRSEEEIFSSVRLPCVAAKDGAT